MIKNNLQKGFSVLELVISIMISAILMTAALTIFQQVSSGSRKIQNITSKDLSFMILEKRLSEDLLGLSAIWFTKENITKKPEAKDESAKTAKSSNTKKQSKEEKEPNIEKNNFFYAQTQNNQLDFMTFISTNTLQSFATPRLYIARIVYLLKPDSSKPGFFILQRKEEAEISNEINVEKIRQGTFYTIVKNIKNCSLEYGFIDLSPEKRAQSPDTEWKMKWVQQWGKEQENEKTENSDSEKYTPKLPDTVRIKITAQELENGPITEHQIYCIVPPSKETSIVSITQKRKEQEASAQQTNLSNADAIMKNVKNSKATAKNLFQTAKG